MVGLFQKFAQKCDWTAQSQYLITIECVPTQYSLIFIKLTYKNQKRRFSLCGSDSSSKMCSNYIFELATNLLLIYIYIGINYRSGIQNGIT